ncbi:MULTISPECIES: dephospho-CoA kinase [Pseudothermotoga]|uniref:dephospho-CoA kinase n=1 Tax=Pseudothermotoga TaxID=1643951 RepID=UPI00074AA0E8|nr:MULTISPECIES: dephospho-CoA kinase [Pseudothermotoga]KUK20079.1 MAG: Dephospho-CoA kinase [Pseudothermotoga lettingae]HBJ81904.1 dephospho-CoA kinase [Pseudothermotoga sp.]
MKFIVGLTGKMGSGKSTVASILKEFGAKVINVDLIGHSVLSNEKVKDSLKKIFGESIFLKGQIDRKKLARIVFSDLNKLSSLEKIVHPLIRIEVEKQVESSDGLIVIDAAILHRLELDKICDIVVLIKSPEDKIIHRLREKGMNEAEIRERLMAQHDIVETDLVIVNDSDLLDLRRKIKNFYNEVIKSKLYHSTGEV